MQRSVFILFVCLSVFLTSGVPALSRPQSATAAPKIEEHHSNSVPSSATSKPNKGEKQGETDKTKRKVESMGIASRITVVLKNGNEYYGGISQINEDSFEVSEIDLKQQFTIRYSDVRKIRSGFGNPNPYTGRRWSTTWHKVALIASVGIVILLVALAAPRT